MLLGTCSKLVAIWKAPKNDAIIAGLLHDIGKCLTRKEMLALCVRNGLEVYDFEIYDNLEALHGKVGSLIFEKEFNKNDIDRFNSISNAIKNHIAGSEDMSLLDKIVFIADNVEPAKGNDILHKIETGEITNINKCIKMLIEEKIKRASLNNREINPLLMNTLEGLDER